MQLLALGVRLGRPRELERALGQVALHRHVVLARLAHVLAQHLADEARHALVAPRRVHARPRRGFPVEGDGDVLQSVACMKWPWRTSYNSFWYVGVWGALWPRT